MWSCGEKLTRPESVGTFWNFSICAASVAPSVEPPARLIAVTTPSIAAGAGDEAAGARLDLLRERRTAALGSSPNTDA